MSDESAEKLTKGKGYLTTKKPYRRLKSNKSVFSGYSLIHKVSRFKVLAHVRPYLEAARAGLVEDLGPMEADLTRAQVILIDRVVSKLAVLRMIEERVRERGVFTHAGNLQPLLVDSYLGYDSAVRMALQALGITRKVGGGSNDLEVVLDRIRKGRDAQTAEGQEIVALKPQGNVPGSLVAPDGAEGGSE